MAHTFKHGDFVRVTLLLERLPRAARAALEIAALLDRRARGRLPRFWADALHLRELAFNDMAQRPDRDPDLDPADRASSLGALLLFVAVLDELRQRAARRQARATSARVEERHARGDFSEDV